MANEFHTIKKSRMKTLKRWFDQEQSSGSGIQVFYLETKGKEFGQTHTYSCGDPNIFISSIIAWICRAIFVYKLDISLDDLLARVITRYHEERRRHEKGENGCTCCANCKFYKEAISEYGNTFYMCKRPDIQQGPKAWIHTKPTDFCSRYERRNVRKKNENS